MTTNDLRALTLPIFERYRLSPESREVALASCYLHDANGHPYMDPYAVRIYRMLAATQPP